VQKEKEKEWREGTEPERARLVAEAEARRAEAAGDEIDKRFAAALALAAEGDHHAAAKAWRKLIKERPHEPEQCYNLANVLQRSDRDVEAASMFLKAMELYKDGTEDWAKAAASAFDLLKLPECDEVPKPEWWNDEGLKALSARVVALAPDDAFACAMRARVLCGNALYSKSPWNAGPRTAAEIKEAATWFCRAARGARSPADKQRYEQLAQACDEVADPLLAEEEAAAAEARAAAEAEASKARAAAKAEAAKALEVAEAKAAAAAKELLAEEEKEKQQRSAPKAGKAKQGKGKKGKGNGK